MNPSFFASKFGSVNLLKPKDNSQIVGTLVHPQKDIRFHLIAQLCLGMARG